ncbi:MAG TPA: bifunctional methylenetetrahydrofolate dehydrogenase/methenyltetrahydrofolate cyclohydrolase FolD [Candidatus Baltobacteraceae bacterium]
MNPAPRIIDGAAYAATVRASVRDGVSALERDRGFVPTLAVVIVGDDPASHVYVRTKTKAAKDAGIRSIEYKLGDQTPEAELLALLGELNARDDVHGILVQLPLPKHISADRIIYAIDPGKDVDGFHPQNAGLLALGKPALVPCTPRGCVMLAKTVHESLRGFETVIIGRSTIVGRPAAQLFLMEDCTTTIAHSRTRDIETVCRRADLLVVAAGKPELVKENWIKPGATVIDVGVNRVVKDNGAIRIVGDVDFESACRVAGAITPVPGGVGPMTVALLLENTLQCARNKVR